MVLRFSSVCACESEEAPMLPSAAPVASAPCRKLRREASAGWLAAAVLLLSWSGLGTSICFSLLLSVSIGLTAPITDCKSETTPPHWMQRWPVNDLE